MRLHFCAIFFLSLVSYAQESFNLDYCEAQALKSPSNSLRITESIKTRQQPLDALAHAKHDQPLPDSILRKEMFFDTHTNVTIEVLGPKRFSKKERSLIKKLLERARAGDSEIEVGAWLITLKSGKQVTAIHTSSQTDSIEGEHLSIAYNKVSERFGFKDEEVERLQYFHNHPGAYFHSLSQNDVAITKVVMADWINNNLPIEMHVYAITNNGAREDWLVAHYSRRSP